MHYPHRTGRRDRAGRNTDADRLEAADRATADDFDEGNDHLQVRRIVDDRPWPQRQCLAARFHLASLADLQMLAIELRFLRGERDKLRRQAAAIHLVSVQGDAIRGIERSRPRKRVTEKIFPPRHWRR